MDKAPWPHEMHRRLRTSFQQMLTCSCGMLHTRESVTIGRSSGALKAGLPQHCLTLPFRYGAVETFTS